MEQAKEYDVIIAGAGIAGLSFLEKLLVSLTKEKPKNKIKILLLDKKDRVGGRICTFRANDENKLINAEDMKTLPSSEKDKSKMAIPTKIVFEGGPSRFSERHTELLSLLKRLKIEISEIKFSSPGPYPSLRVPFRTSLHQDRKKLCLEILKQYNLHQDKEVLGFLQSYNFNSDKVFVGLTETMEKDFKENPKWNVRYSGVSFMKFHELADFYLTMFFETLQTQTTKESQEDYLRAKYLCEKAKEQLGEMYKVPSGLLSGFSEANRNRAFAISSWLRDSLGYSAEIEMSAVFGRGLIHEICLPQKWVVLKETEAERLGGLQGICELYAKILFSQAKTFLPFLQLDVSLGQEIRNLVQTPTGWMLKCTSNLGIDSHIQTLVCKKLVFTGSNLNLAEVIQKLPLQKDKKEEKIQNQNQNKNQNKISSPVLFDFLFTSIVPRVLLRIFAQFPLSQETKKYWFEGIPRITSSGPLRMMIPLQAAKHGVFQISYTDWRYSHPWLKLLEIGKDDGTVKPPTATNVDFGYASPKSKFANVIWTELKKVFPEIQIPSPKLLIYHPCICHYSEPENATSPIFLETKENRKMYKYHDLGKQALNPIENLYVCGEAYNTQYATEMPSGWIESAIRTSFLCYESFWKNDWKDWFS